MHESGEMYLETIYVLSQEKQVVRAVDVARKLGYSKASVSRGLSILKEKGHIDINGGSIILLPSGKEIAVTIYTRHVVLTKLFTEAGVDPKVAEDDACRIEHVISDETFKKLKEKYLD